ncbi:transcriptional regulator with XRE-family HTH domain [Lachnospiraceae bacterium PF1-21]|uniref:Helix-turn-helix domain-containing protein n=1 Tax=Ohessyouella blattaphilus TaxID=2949333 RepID=A0ABT1EFJ8_9FIRM|nr:helix-turn-helix domain-containing protein [Ohessyouella blattaphilus]MCP1109469.1 helix-turn-helix domain-containing protein [Ohessyouella blattaphilus]MCR8562863.1 helix-turn-helix domain-containing protein [Ohessyouella blattaphilus]
MEIGETIKKYRKEAGLTQKEVAKRVGVSAPAVNKWENGYSLPDISLLSPLARLFHVSVDELLAHEKGLTDNEANRLVEEALERLQTEPFEEVLEWMKGYIERYPNAYFLALWAARVFESQELRLGLPEDKKNEEFILDCYQRVLESEEEGLRISAAESLYYFYYRKKDYTKAEQYLAYFSEENPERKRKLAAIYRETNRQEEAYKMLEELLYGSYQRANQVFQDLYQMALGEEDYTKAHLLVDKMAALAQLFEIGKYHEVCQGLELATLEQDEEWTLLIMEQILSNLESLYGFTESPLYAHMEFRDTDYTSYLAKVKEDLLQGLKDEDVYGYMKNNQKWQELKGDNHENIRN